MLQYDTHKIFTFWRQCRVRRVWLAGVHQAGSILLSLCFEDNSLCTRTGYKTEKWLKNKSIISITCPIALAERYTKWYPFLLIAENSSMTPFCVQSLPMSGNTWPATSDLKKRIMYVSEWKLPLHLKCWHLHLLTCTCKLNCQLH